MNPMLPAFGILLWLAAALPLGAAVLQEDFASDPAARGWQSIGDSSLFHWNSANRNLDVTWDSSRTNSFFALPLGTVLTKADDFSFSFDVRLSDISVGTTPGKSQEFQISIGLLNRASATRTNSFAGTGVNSMYGIRNVVEFDYFPDAGLGETFSTVVVSTNNRIYPAHNFPLALTTGDTFRIALHYTASNQLLRTVATRNGAPFGMSPGNALADLSLIGKNDFRVDTFAIISYSDAIQTGPAAFHGSVLAHGTVDNIQLNLPAPPIASLKLDITDSLRRARFLSQSNWSYWLERSATMTGWAPVAGPVQGTGSTLALTDNASSETSFFYRVRAERP